MDKLDMGVKSYPLGSGALRFNPTDPNVYRRFQEVGERLDAICRQPEGEDALSSLAQADEQLKQALGWVFGPGNDFDLLLDGVSLFALGENGRRVLENLLEALEPILAQGAQECARRLLQEDT